jgi:hypothetical protein
MIFSFSIQQVTWMAWVLFDALIGHTIIPFKKYERTLYLLVFSKLLLRTSCIWLFRSRSIVCFAFFYYRSLILYTHSLFCFHSVSSGCSTCQWDRFYLYININRLVRLCLHHLSNITREKFTDNKKRRDKARQVLLVYSSLPLHHGQNIQPTTVAS